MWKSNSDSDTVYLRLLHKAGIHQLVGKKYKFLTELEWCHHVHKHLYTNIHMELCLITETILKIITSK